MRAAGWKLAVGLCGLITAQSANAVTAIGGFTFADDAFADEVVSSSGTFTQIPSGASLSDVLTDVDENTAAFSNDFGAFVQLGFTDNDLVNGADADVVLFELGTLDSVGVSLTFGGDEVIYDFGATDTNGLNAVAINLDDFGVLAGTSVASLIIRMDIESDSMTVPSLSLVGALNTGVAPIPVPAAVWMFGSGLIGLVGIARRRRG